MLTRNSSRLKTKTNKKLDKIKGKKSIKNKNNSRDLNQSKNKKKIKSIKSSKNKNKHTGGMFIFIL